MMVVKHIQHREQGSRHTLTRSDVSGGGDNVPDPQPKSIFSRSGPPEGTKYYPEKFYQILKNIKAGTPSQSESIKTGPPARTNLSKIPLIQNFLFLFHLFSFLYFFVFLFTFSLFLPLLFYLPPRTPSRDFPKLGSGEFPTPFPRVNVCHPPDRVHIWPCAKEWGAQAYIGMHRPPGMV